MAEGLSGALHAYADADLRSSAEDGRGTALPRLLGWLRLAFSTLTEAVQGMVRNVQEMAAQNQELAAAVRERGGDEVALHGACHAMAMGSRVGHAASQAAGGGHDMAIMGLLCAHWALPRQHAWCYKQCMW